MYVYTCISLTAQEGKNSNGKGKITFTEEKLQKIDFIKSVKTKDTLVLWFNILNKKNETWIWSKLMWNKKMWPLRKWETREKGMRSFEIEGENEASKRWKP